MKYLYLEFASITVFLANLFLYRHTGLNNNDLVQKAMLFVTFILILMIVIIIPAMIILSLRDSVSPAKKIKKKKEPFKIKPAEIAKYLIFFILSWIIFIIGKLNNNYILMYLSGAIYLIGMPVLYKNRKQNYGKSFLILITFILVGFLLTLIISGILYSISFKI